MRKLFIFTTELLFIALVSLPCLASAIEINFENIGDQTILSNQYRGVTFSNAMVLTAGISLNELETPPKSGVNVATDVDGPIRIEFSTPVGSVGAYFTYSTPLTVSAYTTSNLLLGSVESAFSSNLALSGQPGSSPNEWLNVIFPKISYILIAGNGLGNSFAVDDVIYSPVPEPTITSLFLVGMLVILLHWAYKEKQRSLARHTKRFSLNAAQTRAKLVKLVSRPLRWLFAVNILILGMFIAQTASAATNLAAPVPDTEVILVSQPTAVTFTVQLKADPTLILTSINIIKYDSAKRVIGTPFRMYDDGTHGDNIANDGLFTTQIILTEQTVGPTYFRTSAAYKGQIRRTMSDFIRVEVTDEGLPQNVLDRLDHEVDVEASPENTILPNGQILADYLRSRGISIDDLLKSGSSLKAFDPPYVPSTAAELPVASGPQQKKNDVVGVMLALAEKYACGRQPTPCKIWDFPAEASDPVNKPAQHGLTYVYGGRSPEIRKRPLDGCPEMTHGLDCSGLIIRISALAGLGAPPTAAEQRYPSNWTVPAEWKLTLKDVAADGDIQPGDIVVWSSHAGIANHASQVISATGRPSKLHDSQCKPNINPPKGPRALNLSQLGLGAPIAVLRLVASLNDTWDLAIKCTAQSTDAATIRFSISTDSGGEFSAKGKGTDYNGAPLSFVLAGKYDDSANLLTALLSFADGSRSDSFSQRLLTDVVGYFALTKVVDNGGCNASAKLTRVAAASSVIPQSLNTAPKLVSGPRLGGP